MAINIYLLVRWSKTATNAVSWDTIGLKQFSIAIIVVACNLPLFLSLFYLICLHCYLIFMKKSTIELIMENRSTQTKRHQIHIAEISKSNKS